MHIRYRARPVRKHPDEIVVGMLCRWGGLQVELGTGVRMTALRHIHDQVGAVLRLVLSALILVLFKPKRINSEAHDADNHCKDEPRKDAGSIIPPVFPSPTSNDGNDKDDYPCDWSLVSLIHAG